MELRRWSTGALIGLTWSGVLACSAGGDEEISRFGGALGPSGGFGHGQTLSPTTGLRSALAPRGAHLDYFGGRVVSNLQVVVVLYGSGSYIPEVVGGAGTDISMASFFGGVLASPYVDWLTEYDTTQQTHGTGQTIGRGTFLQQVAIVPSRRNNGTVIDDSSIQAELGAQIQAGALPGPTHDALGNNNTYYAIFFPHGKTIRDQGSASCSAFCAYHGTVARTANLSELYYGVHPDMQAGSGCERGCGKAATLFGNYTQVASHEMVETITDPEVGLATTFAPPLAWYDRSLNQEISDLCAGQDGQVLGRDGVTYDVQTAFSNSRNDCVVTVPRANAISVDPSVNACGDAPGAVTVTVLGGPGQFEGDVALRLLGVSPAPPAGGEITATFDPDPILQLPPSGSGAVMRAQATASTPPATYDLTVEAASAGLTATATLKFSVFSGPPASPALISPSEGSDDVSSVPMFSWSSDPRDASYTLEIFAGSSCEGAPARSDQTRGASFDLSAADALPPAQAFSWRVTSTNVCGSQPSPCSAFRTAS